MKLEIEKRVPCRVPRLRIEELLKMTVRKYGKGKLKDVDEFSLAFVGSSEMKKLNQKYRGKNEPTDVLSFEYGEVIVCVPVAVRQAKEHKMSLNDEFCLLFTHGVLHVLGYDHEKPKDAVVMRAAEQALLGFDGLITIAHR